MRQPSFCGVDFFQFKKFNVQCLYPGILNLLHTQIMNMSKKYVVNTNCKLEIKKYLDRLKCLGMYDR
jgi:hypothetical protein